MVLATQVLCFPTLQAPMIINSDHTVATVQEDTSMEDITASSGLSQVIGRSRNIQYLAANRGCSCTRSLEDVSYTIRIREKASGNSLWT